MAKPDFTLVFSIPKKKTKDFNVLADYRAYTVQNNPAWAWTAQQLADSLVRSNQFEAAQAVLQRLSPLDPVCPSHVSIEDVSEPRNDDYTTVFFEFQVDE